ncbi:MAG TPA: hypothetical protein VHO48_10210, partial [Anaerolineaceae bacterium]|nr:hypothetical protein [Anaerolineaceae bacterium]
SRMGVRNKKFILERPDGTDRVISANIEPLISPEGRFIGAINVFQDITDHKEADRLVGRGKIRNQSGREGDNS